MTNQVPKKEPIKWKEWKQQRNNSRKFYKVDKSPSFSELKDP